MYYALVSVLSLAYTSHKTPPSRDHSTGLAALFCFRLGALFHRSDWAQVVGVWMAGAKREDELGVDGAHGSVQSVWDGGMCSKGRC